MQVDRQGARVHMIERLGAETLCWEMPGPPDTVVAVIQCWAIPTDYGSRLVIIELFEEHGFMVFPQIMSAKVDFHRTIISAMEEAEQIL